MDLPQRLWKELRQRGHDLGQVQGMNSHENKSEQGVAPYVTQGVPRVNADVRKVKRNEAYIFNFMHSRNSSNWLP